MINYVNVDKMERLPLGLSIPSTILESIAPYKPPQGWKLNQTIKQSSKEYHKLPLCEGCVNFPSQGLEALDLQPRSNC